MNNLQPLVNNYYGVRLPSGTRAAEQPHASQGGNLFPAEIRALVLQMWLNDGGRNGGFDALKNPQVQLLCGHDKVLHFDTCRGWLL